MSGHSKHSTLIIIPAKNEALSIKKVIADIRVYFQGTILVIDDASTDDTAYLARQSGAVVLSLIFSLGAWGAIQTGLHYACKQGYNNALTMDADGQHEAASIPILLEKLQTKQCDVIIGAYPARGSRARKIAWHLFRYLSGVQLEDLTSGLRAYNHSAMTLLASKSATLLDYQDMGVLMLLTRAGLSIQEVPIFMNPRVDGHSRIFSSWWAVGRYMLHTLILCLAQRQSSKSKFL